MIDESCIYKTLLSIGFSEESIDEFFLTAKKFKNNSDEITFFIKELEKIGFSVDKNNIASDKSDLFNINMITPKQENFPWWQMNPIFLHEVYSFGEKCGAVLCKQVGNVDDTSIMNETNRYLKAQGTLVKIYCSFFVMLKWPR